MNMTFSSVSSDMKNMMNKFTAAEESCERHSTPLIKMSKNIPPFCPECAKEKVAQDEKELIERETEKAESRNKRWLKLNSIYSDDSLTAASFETYKTADQETTLNKEKALNIAREYYKGKTFNTILNGKYGTGKSHLAMSVLKTVNEHSDKKCLFISVDELFRLIKDSWNNHGSKYTEESMKQLLITADLLVLDDLGAEVGSVNMGKNDKEKRASDFIVKVLNAVLNGRVKKPTIFTTNLNNNNLKQIYDGRIISRMLQGVNQDRVITFKTTPDKRVGIDF